MSAYGRTDTPPGYWQRAALATPFSTTLKRLAELEAEREGVSNDTVPPQPRSFADWALEDRAEALSVLRDALVELCAHGRVSGSALPTVRRIEQFLAKVER